MSKASCTAPARNHLPDTYSTDPNPAPLCAQAPGSSPPAPAPASPGHWRPAALPAPSHLAQVLPFRACSVILCFYQSHSPALKSLNVFPQNSRMISSSQNNFSLSKSILISCTRRRHLLTKPSDLPTTRHYVMPCQELPRQFTLMSSRTWWRCPASVYMSVPARGLLISAQVQPGTGQSPRKWLLMEWIKWDQPV